MLRVGDILTHMVNRLIFFFLLSIKISYITDLIRPYQILQEQKRITINTAQVGVKLNVDKFKTGHIHLIQYGAMDTIVASSSLTISNAIMKIKQREK